LEFVDIKCIFVLMLTILPHIKYLIRSNDCVIVPDFGAFISHTNHSFVKDGILFAPCRQLGFNEALRHNDGLIANSLMRKCGISYDKAMRIVAEDVNALKVQLRETGEAYLDGIGKFVLSEDNLLSFTSLQNMMLVSGSDFFGLSDMRLPSLDSMDDDEDNAAAHRKEFIYFPVRRSFFRVAASIIVLVAMAFVLSTPIRIDNHPDYAGFKSVAGASDTVAVEKADMAAVKDTTVAVIENSKLQKLSVEKSEANYYAVVATFKSERQAKLFVQQSSIDSLEINNDGGLYRVFAFSGESYDDVRERMEESSLLKTVPDAWIYKKRING